jgi:glycogen debranching enzyme
MTCYRVARAGVALLLVAVTPVWQHGLLAQSDYAAATMAGLSNGGRNPGRPYAAAGDRAYLIGTQDGNFPDLGEHVPGEMGGLWVQPIKVIDGFRAVLTDSATGREAALLKAEEFINYPYGNRLRYGSVLDGIDLERFQFSPDGQAGVVVQYIFVNRTGRPRQLGIRISVKSDLRPVWFSEELGITDAPDTVEWDSTSRRFAARDTRHPWFALWGAPHADAAEPLPRPDPLDTRGPGALAGTRYHIAVAPHATDTLTLVFAGSPASRAEAERSYAAIARQHQSLLAKKKARYTALLERSRIRIPDRRLQEVYNWVKVNMEWLIKDVPGMGRGLTAALPEYPWWFGTETYSLQALLAAGNAELAQQTLRLLRDQSAKANGNGRIIHEVTTNGGLSNPGNTQETAQWILTAGMVYDWTGDRAFARKMYPAMKQGLHWLLTDMDQNRNLFPEGYGIMEVTGLNAELIDVAVYTHQALLSTARVADVLGEPRTAERYRDMASRLATRIQDRFWIEEESSYADFYGTRDQAVSVAAGAARQLGLKGQDQLTERERELIRYYDRLQQTFVAMADSSRGWLTNKNWVIATPMETGMAPRARAIRALDQIRRNNLGEHGPYLSATERLAMMTISTGVQAVAESKYGRTDESLWYMDKIVRTFNRTVPGSISEMMPDYGSFTIAWTAYGIVLPLVQHIFGIQPDAGRKTVVLEPHLPSGWEEMSIGDVAVGSNLISFSRSKTDRGIEYQIDSRESGWTFVLKGDAVRGGRYYLNGKPVSFPSEGIRMTGRKNQVLVEPR